MNLRLWTSTFSLRPSLMVILAAFALVVSSGCKSVRSVSRPQMEDGLITIAILQMNDVYEIAGIDGGKAGGLQRVAGYYQQLQKQYPQSMMVLAGDFLNPSLIGTIRYEGERMKGKQMIDVLNAMNLDLVAFGNHEFDLDEKDLQARLNESSFDWIATNIRQVCGDKTYPFYREEGGKQKFIPETRVYTFQDTDGTSLDLGFFSATINSNPKSYVQYFNPDSCIDVELAHLRTEADVIIGLTHLSVDDDLKLAGRLQDVPLIMGGHEHDHMLHTVGHSVVAKADANAKTVYLHILRHNTRNKTTDLTSQLVAIDTTTPVDQAVSLVVNKWTRILDDKVREIIPDPYEVIYTTQIPLDGRESQIRHQQTHMGTMFTSGMMASSKHQATAAILNSGAIRIDDELEGGITSIDIFRALPFGGVLFDVEMNGRLLLEVLNYSLSSKGNGAFLQLSQITYQEGQWLLAGQPIIADQSYMIVLNDFLLAGSDIPFLTPKHADIKNVFKPAEGDTADLRSDIRKAIIDYMKKL